MAQKPDSREDRCIPEKEARDLLGASLDSGPLGPAELKLMGLVKMLRGENRRLEAEVENLGGKNIELVFQVQEFEQNLKQVREHLEESGREGARVRAEMQEALTRAEDLSRALEDSRQQALQEQGRVVELEGRLGEAQTRLDDLVAGQADLDRDLQRQAESLESLEEELSRSRSRQEELEAEVLRLGHELEGEKARREQAETESRDLKTDLAEHSRRLEESRSELEGARLSARNLEGQLAETLQEKTELEASFQEAMARSEALEQTLLQVREQFLQKVELPPRPESPPADFQASPDRAMAALMKSLLGSTGPVLVRRVYARCEVDPASRDPQAHLRVLLSLEETASRLVSTPEKRERLVLELERLRSALSSRVEASESLPEPSAEEQPVAVALPEQLTSAPVEPMVEETIPDVPEDPGHPVEVRPEEAPLPAAEEPRESGDEAPPEEATIPDVPEDPGHPVEVPPEEAPLPAAEESRESGDEAPPEEATVPDVPEDPGHPVEVRPEEAPLPAAEGSREPGDEAPSEEASAPALWRVLGAEDDELPFRRASDPALCARIEEGMKLVALEKFDNAWDIFQKLAQEHPDVLEIQEGLFYNYFGSFCFNEALEIGRRILVEELKSPGADRFVTAMHTVLIERLKAVRDAAERKRIFLNLAEIHLDDPPQALEFLTRAHRIPGRGPLDARIHYYRLHLQAGDAAEQFRDVLGALEGLADHPELFDHLDRVSSQARFRAFRPAAQVVLALVRQGREAAAEAEKEGGERVAAVDLDPNLIEEEHDERVDQIVEFLLNRLLPRGEVAVPFPDPEFSALLADSQPAPAGWKPAELLDRLAWRLFRRKKMQVHLYSGKEAFWVRAVPEPKPQVLFHPEVANLPALEQQGLALRVLFHLHHRHFHLRRAAEILDNPTRCRLLGLTRDVVEETGTDVSDSLEREIDSLDPERPDLDLWLDQMLKRLYDHCLREEFLILRDFFKPGRLFLNRLEGSADRFVSRLVGLTAASYGIVRTELGHTPLFQELEKEGLQALYRPPLPTWRSHRARLQRLWVSALR
jgi:hypothetical protein